MTEQPGHDKAVASIVLGIMGIILWFFGYSSILSLALGIAGLIVSAQAKKAGNTEGIQTAGFVLSLICTLVGAIIFISCVACVACGVAVGGFTFAECLRGVLSSL